jgi:hypothetical protein
MTTPIDAPTLDVTVGLMATVLPPLAPPVFLRLAPPVDELVDRARGVFVSAANVDLRTCRAEWRAGAGVLVERVTPDTRALAAEVHALGRALRALGVERIARSYLELMASHVTADDGRDVKPEKEDPTCKQQ